MALPLEIWEQIIQEFAILPATLPTNPHASQPRAHTALLDRRALVPLLCTCKSWRERLTPLVYSSVHLGTHTTPAHARASELLVLRRPTTILRGVLGYRTLAWVTRLALAVDYSVLPGEFARFHPMTAGSRWTARLREPPDPWVLPPSLVAFERHCHLLTRLVRAVGPRLVYLNLDLATHVPIENIPPTTPARERIHLHRQAWRALLPILSAAGTHTAHLEAFAISLPCDPVVRNDHALAERFRDRDYWRGAHLLQARVRESFPPRELHDWHREAWESCFVPLLDGNRGTLRRVRAEGLRLRLMTPRWKKGKRRKPMALRMPTAPRLSNLELLDVDISRDELFLLLEPFTASGTLETFRIRGLRARLNTRKPLDGVQRLRRVDYEAGQYDIPEEIVRTANVLCQLLSMAPVEELEFYMKRDVFARGLLREVFDKSLLHVMPEYASILPGGGAMLWPTLRHGLVGPAERGTEADVLPDVRDVRRGVNEVDLRDEGVYFSPAGKEASTVKEAAGRRDDDDDDKDDDDYRNEEAKKPSRWQKAARKVSTLGRRMLSKIAKTRKHL